MPPGAGPGAAAAANPMPGATAGAAATTPMVPAANKPVTRADRPAVTANPDELKAKPDGKGLVMFNFQGQPWLEVLEWLAKISHLSLDWQELPGDQLNLATQRGYTVVEARDLINRHLMDRGYTLLRNGDVLTVVNIKKLDPSLVPRVRPADLSKREPHEFVKVSFSLDWMLAEHAVEELKPMLSPNGKLSALKSTNRVEAMDAVINLLAIYEVLQEEQSREGKEQLVKEFELKNSRAADVDRMLRALMGMQKNQDVEGGGGGGSPQPDQFMAIQQQLQQMQQMQQQQGQQPPGAGGGAKKEIFIVVNTKRNSLLVQAPADKMAIITQAVDRLDVGKEQNGSLMHAVNSTKIYRLSEIDPAALAKILDESGNLDPTTRIKVDAKHRCLIVSGALADHMVITELIKKLDGTDRRFEVIRLRRLQSDYVAGTIEFMMGVQKKDENENQNPFMMYRFGMDIGGGGGDDKKGTSKFRVSADTENNRLLLWTNDIELKEVHNLLIKLGEVPPKDGSPEKVRVVDTGDSKMAKRLANQLMKTRPDFKIEIQEEPTPEETEPIPPKADELIPPTTGAGAQRRPPQARKAAAVRKPAVTKTEGPQAVAPARRPGQSGRILRAGRAIPNVMLANLQVPATETEPELDAAPAAPAKPKATPKRQPRPIFNPNRPVLPTFAEDAVADSQPAEGERGEDETEQSESEIEQPEADPRSQQPRSRAFTRTPRDSEIETEFSPGGSEIPDLNPDQPELRSPRKRVITTPKGVQVMVTADGQLIIASENTRALDELEDILTEIAPPRRDFKIFHLKNRNTWPTGVVWNLEKYFGTEEKKGGGMKYSPYWGMYPSDKKDSGPNSLSKRRIPKFIADSDSHTILVTGADPEQLRVIQELIDIYDKPDVSDNKALRLTKIFQLKYSKARIVADAVKEVYRDLLSVNDPALQAANQNNKDQKPVAAERQYTYIYGSGEDDKDKGKEPEVPIKFKGLLSLGVDELSNTVIVSSQEGLLDNIGQMIDALDAAARPTLTTVQVLKVGRHVESSGLQERLSKLLTRPQPVHPPGQPHGNPNQPQPGQPGQQAGQPVGAEGGQ
jgi:type II secretory pathway component GspD/PulD (secretin)